MNAKHRMYSIPYNGTSPKWFLQETLKRKNNIDHVYCELPYEEMLSHVRFTFDGKNEEHVDRVDANLKRANYIKNCVEFLRISKGLIRRICPVNAMYYRFNSQDELHTFALNLAKAATYYQLEGLIISDYRVAALVHALLPELELHTSCNA